MTSRLPRWASGLLLVATAVVSACGGSGGAADERLPALQLPILGGGEQLALDTVDGPAVVNLWATWCAPCRRELPDFQQVHVERGDTVRFIGVNIGDREDQAQAFLDELGVTFENYLDFDGALNAALETATLPVTVVTGPDGTISVVHSGPMDAADLDRELDRALAAAADD